MSWWPTSADDHAALVDLVADVSGTAPALISVTHACRSCGSHRHGKVHAVLPAGSSEVHVSLSRSQGLTIAAVTDAGPVGVDVEAVTADCDDLVAWVRTESLVKATGHGLTIDPALLDDVVRRTVDLDAPRGFVAAATVLTDQSPQVVTQRAAPGA